MKNRVLNPCLSRAEYVERHEFAFDEVIEESVCNGDVYDRTTREVTPT